MNSPLLNKVEQNNIKADLPEFSVGDTIELDLIVREGDKNRVQKFKGLVIAIKGSGTRKMVTVRKISNGVGVEKIIPVNSPNVSAITVIKTGAVRKSKIYYMRDRVGKSAMRVKQGKSLPEVVVEGSSEVESEA